jgi:hypothetical protein
VLSVFGCAGASVTGYKMSRRMRGLTEFHLVPLHSDFPLTDLAASAQEDQQRQQQAGPFGFGSYMSDSPGLPVFVCIPGWVEEGQDPRRVWGGAALWAAASPVKTAQRAPTTGTNLDGFEVRAWRSCSAAKARAWIWTSVDVVSDLAGGGGGGEGAGRRRGPEHELGDA